MERVFKEGHICAWRVFLDYSVVAIGVDFYVHFVQ